MFPFVFQTERPNKPASKRAREGTHLEKEILLLLILIFPIACFASLRVLWWKLLLTTHFSMTLSLFVYRGGRNRIGRREKWPQKSWEEGEIGGKSREEGEKET